MLVFRVWEVVRKESPLNFPYLDRNITILDSFLISTWQEFIYMHVLSTNRRS